MIHCKHLLVLGIKHGVLPVDHYPFPFFKHVFILNNVMWKRKYAGKLKYSPL